MITVVFIAGVVVASAVVERRLVEQGNVVAARTVKHFSRWFLIGAGGYLVVLFGVAVAALFTI